MKVVRGIALAGQVDYLVTRNLSDHPAVLSPAQFMETSRKGNQ
jgi:hypothetical protein